MLWSFTAVLSIHAVCATYEVRQDEKALVGAARRRISFDDLEAVRKMHGLGARFPSRREPGGSNPVATWWNGLGGPGQVLASIVGINLCTLVPSMSSQSMESFLWRRFAHYPAEPLFRYHQLLTCAFLHSGPFHMGMNMLVMYNFGPTLAHAPAFQSSGSAFLAFCLSAAVSSSLGSHLSTLVWPNKFQRFTFGLGFSGVAMAIVASTCVAFPHAKLSVFPLPMQFEAGSFLDFLKMFEFLGVLGVVGRLIPAMTNVGYAAHLSGLLFGEAYGRWSKQGELWTFMREAAFRVKHE